MAGNANTSNKRSKKAAHSLRQLPEAAEGGTLRQLCPEDKRRVATLVHNLALALHDRDRAVGHLDQAVVSLQASDERLDRLREQNDGVISECIALRQRYMQSLELVKQYQQGIEEQQLRHAQTLTVQQVSHAETVQQLRDRLALMELVEHERATALAETRQRPAGPMTSVEVQTTETVRPLLVAVGARPSAVDADIQTDLKSGDMDRLEAARQRSPDPRSLQCVGTQMDRGHSESSTTQTETQVTTPCCWLLLPSPFAHHHPVRCSYPARMRPVRRRVSLGRRPTWLCRFVKASYSRRQLCRRSPSAH